MRSLQKIALEFVTELAENSEQCREYVIKNTSALALLPHIMSRFLHGDIEATLAVAKFIRIIEDYEGNLTDD